MKPFHGPNQVHDAEKSAIELLVARCHSSVDFHALKQVLHQVARPVFQSIKRPLLLAIGFGWNDHLHAFAHRLLHDGIAVIGFVCQQLLPRQTLDQSKQLGRIGFVARRQFEAQRVAQGVAHRMDFGVQPTARDANCLRSLFFCAPALAWCALQEVESTINCS